MLLSLFVALAAVMGFSYAIIGGLCTEKLVPICQAAMVVVAPSQPKAKTIAPLVTPVPKSLKGIYMTAEVAISKYGKELVASLLESGGNTVVIDVQHGGGLLAFNPKSESLRKLNPGSGRLNDLQFLVRDLQSQGIYVIARQVVFNQPYMATRKPEWRVKGRWGGYYPEKWLDPSHPDVQDYNLGIFREVAEMGFDEIQFDYIRFPAANHRNYDYYFDETTETPADIIVNFLARAKSVANDYGMAVGADVFGVIVWGDVDWKIVGQDPTRIAKVVDAIYPMVYPSHFGNGFNGYQNPHNAPYKIVHDSIKRFVEASNGNAEIRPWIQGFPLKVNYFGSWFMEEQVNASFDAGANDFVIWSPGNRYGYSWPSFKLEPKEEIQAISEKIEPAAASNP